MPTARPFHSPGSLARPDHQARIGQLEQELAQARAESAATQQHLHHLTTHLPEGLLLLDANRCVALINEQCCQLLELLRPASQWLGAPMATITALVQERVADPAGYAAGLAQAQQPASAQPYPLLHLRNGRVAASS